MNETIHKFELQITDRQEVVMSRTAKVLSVQFQRGNLCVWALVDKDHDSATFEFSIYGTGNPITESVGQYVGTVQQNSGTLVWHVFYKFKGLTNA